jgi:hypothetical protein
MIPLNHIRRDRFASSAVYVWCLILLQFALITRAYAGNYVRIAAELDLFVIENLSATQPSGATVTIIKTNHLAIPVVCVVGTNVWQLDGDFVTGAKTRWYFDGTNVCLSLQHKEEKPDNPALANGAAPLDLHSNSQTAETKPDVTIDIQVTPGGYPPDDVEVNIPWLAFCSGSFLKQSERIIPLPTSALGHAPDAFAYSDKTVTFEDALGLPKEIEMFTSASLYHASVKQFWPNRKELPSSENKDGIRKFHYIVTQSTNFQGWHFPLEFEYTQDLPGYYLQNPATHYGSGKVISIQTASEPEGVFDLSQNQTVVDWRFEHETKPVHGLIYPSPGKVLPTNDPVLQAEYALAIQRASH